MHLPENHSGATSDSHLVSLWVSGRPENTKEAYLRDSAKFLEAISPRTLQDATVGDVVAWANNLDGAPATKSRKVSVVKSLFSYAHRTGYTTFNVALVLRVPRPPNKLHERIVDPETVRAITQEACEGRDQVLVRFLYASGCRATEAVTLRYKDLKGNRVTFQGKGAKSRTVLIPSAVADELRSLRWSKDSETAPIFKSFRGNSLSRQDVHKIVSKAAENAGCEISAHWLRHAHASHSLDNGAPIHLVQQTLGHENVATTSRYLHAKPNDSSSRFLQF